MMNVIEPVPLEATVKDPDESVSDPEPVSLLMVKFLPFIKTLEFPADCTWATIEKA